MDDRLLEYLNRIRVASENAIRFATGMTFGDFLLDEKTQQATVMSFFIVGETATKIVDRFPSFADAHTEIPWRSMRGLRNRIAHDYFDLDFQAIWDTVHTELPTLLRQIEAVREDQA